MLVINADDWGRDIRTTNLTLDCFGAGALSATSGMVFMSDSERAAGIALEHRLDVGLHLNLTTPFTAAGLPSRLRDDHARICAYLRRRRLAQVMFHPGLTGAFEYVVKAQLDEFTRLYGTPPARIDGHHHMHLCANVMAQRLLPSGTLVRRNFTFAAGEKSGINRAYRSLVDFVLSRRHRVVDFLFSLPPIEPLHRLDRIFRFASRGVVELETHAANIGEYKFLAEREIFARLPALQIAAGFPGGR
jgi:predicted glycoside hydrolase/deacetylase ChbG (UPF0249 family)